MFEQVTERFFSRVDQSDLGGCWVWMGAKNPKGYGNFQVNGVQVSVHRWAYESFVGEIPDGMTIDHECNNTSCVRPSHLRVMTNKKNNLRGMSPSAQNARKTHCPKGHSYTNYVVKGRPRRECLTCKNERRRSHV